MNERIWGIIGGVALLLAPLITTCIRKLQKSREAL